MYQTKSKIYLSLDKTQKSAICNYIRALVKQSILFSTEEILEKFLEDEKYYLKLNASRFPFLSEIIEDYHFLQDTKEYIKACKKYYEYKEKQRPVIEANKEFERKKRKFLQEVKMSKEKPTKKQLYYYDRLCKKYSIEKKDVNTISKLEIRDEIERIIHEHANTFEIND